MKPGTPIICFVVALKSKAVSKDWDRVCRLFEATLGSLLGQSNPRWRAFVVGHERPTFPGMDDERVHFLPVDFPPPVLNYDRMTEDKTRKLSIALRACLATNPQYIMSIDADDLLSSRLVEFAATAAEKNGWIIHRGYNYTYGSRWIVRNNQFNCGTNAIINVRLVRAPSGASLEQDAEECLILRFGHVDMERGMKDLGKPLEQLPFRGVVYLSDHGENATDAGPWGGRGRKRLRWWLNMLRTAQPLTRRLREEFNLHL